MQIPEALGDVGILLFLLDHQAPLLPQLEHGVLDGQLLHVGVLDVQPELEDGNVGACPPYPGTAVNQNGPILICKSICVQFDRMKNVAQGIKLCTN